VKTAMAMGKEMQFAIDRYKALRDKVKAARLQGGANVAELVRERNNALAEAIALVKAVEQHLSGEYKERLHALHLHLEKRQQAETGA
jgi:hypothetical protein